MSSSPSKMHGNKDAAVGSVKENVGSAVGNHSLEAKGKAQNAKGNAEVEAVKAQGYAKGAADKTKGSVKDTVGSLTGNHSMKYEGKADKAEGDAKMNINS